MKSYYESENGYSFDEKHKMVRKIMKMLGNRIEFNENSLGKIIPLTFNKKATQKRVLDTFELKNEELFALASRQRTFTMTICPKKPKPPVDNYPLVEHLYRLYENHRTEYEHAVHKKKRICKFVEQRCNAVFVFEL